jgi:hypothetical protein
MSTWSAELLVRDCSSLLDRQAFPERVTTLVGPQAVTVRLGPKTLGHASSCLVTPRGSVPDLHHLFPGVTVPWGNLPYPGGEGLSPCQKGPPCRVGECVVCVLRGKAPKPELKRSRVQCSRTFLLRARDVYGYVLPGGAPTVTANARHPGGPRVSYEMVCSYV